MNAMQYLFEVTQLDPEITWQCVNDVMWLCQNWGKPKLGNFRLNIET